MLLKTRAKENPGIKGVRKQKLKKFLHKTPGLLLTSQGKLSVVAVLTSPGGIAADPFIQHFPAELGLGFGRIRKPKLSWGAGFYIADGTSQS